MVVLVCEVLPLFFFFFFFGGHYFFEATSIRLLCESGWTFATTCKSRVLVQAPIHSLLAMTQPDDLALPPDGIRMRRVQHATRRLDGWNWKMKTAVLGGRRRGTVRPRIHLLVWNWGGPE